MNGNKTRATAALLIAAAAAVALTACSSRPKLNQVDSAASDKPINTPEAAAALKRSAPEHMTQTPTK